MATPEMNYRMTVGDLQALLSKLPDSVPVTVTIPAGFVGDRRFGTSLDLHVTATEPKLELSIHSFDSASEDVDIFGKATGTPPKPQESSGVTRPELPRPYSEWRSEPGSREEDAAYWFGYYLMTECRRRALKSLGPDATEKERANVAQAVDTALNGTMDLLEGYWRIDIDTDRTESFRLLADITNDEGAVVETIQIAPCDLQIGYWKWRDGGFR